MKGFQNQQQKVSSFKKLFNDFCVSKQFIDDYFIKTIKEQQIKETTIDIDEYKKTKYKLILYEKQLKYLTNELSKLKK